VTEPIIVVLISAIPSILGGLAALAAAFIGWVNHKKLNIIKVEINSRFSQLLSLTAKSSEAKGARDERARAELEKDESGYKNIKN